MKFYRQFVATAKGDPGGVKALRKVLGESDLEAFKRKWEGFVLKLKYPR